MRLRAVLAGAAVALAGIGLAGYMLTPVHGPPRDLSLSANPEHGRYVMILGGCVACHTDRRHNRPLLAGGEAIRTRFGDFYPPNITPDETYGIGGWTLAQFSAALSDGQGPHGPLYPVFPYASYTLLSDQDIADLFAALQRVPPVAEPAPANRVTFPFGWRRLMAAWQHLFFTPGRYRADPERTPAWNRGAFLAMGPGHCVECHSPRNLLGAPLGSQAFEGSLTGPSGKAPPITADALRQDGYDHARLVRALRTGVAPDHDRFGGPMAEVVGDSTSQWKDADLEAIATYLLSKR